MSIPTLRESRVGVAIAKSPGSDIYEQSGLVEALIREALIAGGLGRKDPKAPLRDIVEVGMSVLLKPNWVLHVNLSGSTMDCMVTHRSFISAVVREVARAKPRRIIIADAPIQRTDFTALASESWTAKLREAAAGADLEILDLRNLIAFYCGRRLDTKGDIRDPSRFVLFDLGGDSLLEPISTPVGRFRNTGYNPDDMGKVQRPGEHKYLLCKEPFEADLLINLPKLKAHGKAGLTAALKNLVGINGDKNFLPHHRVGGTAWGGDCYVGFKPFKRLSEYCLDQANRRIGRNSYVLWKQASDMLNAVHGGDLEGKWYGNDTVWRMALDINRLLLYGRPDGTLSNTPLRTIYSITDGIVAGEANGPLASEPVSLGAVTFASNSAYADLVHAALMRFDWRKIPLVREAFRKMNRPLVQGHPEDLAVSYGNRNLTLSETAQELGLPFRPPRGWVGRIEWKESASS